MDKLLKDTRKPYLLPINAERLVIDQINNITQAKRMKAIEEKMTTGAFRGTPITLSYVDAMSGVDFGKFLGELYKLQGFQVELTPVTGDHGADLIIEKFGERTAIQAKCYSGIVSNDAVQEVIGAKAIYQCQRAIVVSNSYFSKGAKVLAEANQVELWDRDRLQIEIKNSPVLQ